MRSGVRISPGVAGRGSSQVDYQSDFARRHVAEGEARGEARGRAALIVKLLASRFGALTRQTEARIVEASIEELDQIGERLLIAQTLNEALG